MADHGYEDHKIVIRNRVETIDAESRILSKNIGYLVENKSLLDTGLIDSIGDRLKKAQYLYIERQQAVAQLQLINDLENGVMYTSK